MERRDSLDIKRKIVELLLAHGELRRAELAEATGLGRDRLRALVDGLVKQGSAVKAGRALKLSPQRALVLTKLHPTVAELVVIRGDGALISRDKLLFAKALSYDDNCARAISMTNRFLDGYERRYKTVDVCLTYDKRELKPYIVPKLYRHVILREELLAGGARRLGEAVLYASRETDTLAVAYSGRVPKGLCPFREDVLDELNGALAVIAPDAVAVDREAMESCPSIETVCTKQGTALVIEDKSALRIDETELLVRMLSK